MTHRRTFDDAPRYATTGTTAITPWYPSRGIGRAQAPEVQPRVARTWSMLAFPAARTWSSDARKGWANGPSAPMTMVRRSTSARVVVTCHLVV